MNIAVQSLVGTFLFAVSAVAGERVSPEQLPASVVTVLVDYFPGSTIVAVERETKRDVVCFEVVIRYRDLRLEVETNEEGKIFEVEMKK